MACGGGLTPTEDRAHYLKYISLLNDGGKLVLLDKIKNSVPRNDIPAHLQREKPKLTVLHRKHIISDSEYDLLFPQTGQPDPSKFDITLLTCLLRSTCGLNAWSAVWDPQKPPVDADTSVEADIVRLRNWRNRLIGHPEKTQLSEQEFKDHWASLEKVLLRLGANILNLKSFICDLKSHTIDPRREADLMKELTAWNIKYESLEEDVENIKEDVYDIQCTQGIIQQRQEDIQQKQEDIQHKQNTVQQKQEHMQQLQDDMKTNQEHIQQIQYDSQRKQEGIQQKQEIIKQRQEDMQQNQDDIKERQQDMQQNQADIQQSQEDVLQKLKDMRQKHDDIQQKQDDMQQTQDDMKQTEEDIQQQLKTLEKKQAGSTTTIENLRATLLDLYKDSFQCIPIYLLNPERKYRLRDMYVSQELKAVDHRGEPENSDHAEKRSGTGSRHIAAVRDIFYKDGRRCKGIFVSGEPGIGKSTFCEHLVQLWCDAHSASDNTTLTEDLKAMLEFKLLFYMSLGEVSITSEAPRSDEIAMLIYELLELADICTVSDIRKCLSDPSTLVLMDSLDELSSKRLPRRGLHNKSCIVITSRPWKLEALRSQLEGKVDQQIEIVGLRKGSPEKLAKNVLKHLNKEFNLAKRANLFIQKMEMEGLEDCLNIPILVIQMISLWYDGESFGNSQYEIYSKMIHHQILAAIKAKELPNLADKRTKDFPLCCNTAQCPCKMYEELLWKVAKLAYHTLFSEDREMCLVFDHEVTAFHGLSAGEVELCLKLGILTQHKLFVKKLTVEKKYVSFLHKTNQEYFASIFLVTKGQGSGLQDIHSVISDLDRALELDKILLFCSQLNAEVARQLSHLISSKAEDDRRVEEYRLSCCRHDPPNTDLVEKVQNIIISAIQQKAKLFLSDIYRYTSRTTTIFTRESCMGSYRFRRCRNIDVLGLDMAEVKSIHIQNPVDSTTWMAIKQLRRLQKLVLYKCKLNVECVREMVLGNKDTMRTLGLYGEWSNKLDLSPLGDRLTELLDGNHLTSLGLGGLQLSHTQCQILTRYFSTTGNLREVRLECIRCSTHSFRSGCSGALYLKNHKFLNSVELQMLPPFTDVDFHAAHLQQCVINLPVNVSVQASSLRCLKTARNLQVFRCDNLIDSLSINDLFTVLPQLDSLQRIELNDIEFVSFTEIRWSAKLESVKLYRCKITDEGLGCLVNSLSAHTVNVVLCLITIRGRENILQSIREFPNTEVLGDKEVKYQNGEWNPGWFEFYINK